MAIARFSVGQRVKIIQAMEGLPDELIGEERTISHVYPRVGGFDYCAGDRLAHEEELEAA